MLSGANNYFNNRLWTDEWDNSTDGKKNAALTMALNQVDSLSVVNRMSTEDYNKAVFEQALFLLQLGPEDRQRLKMQSQGVERISISGGVSEAYVIDGIAYCATVRQLIKKYKFQVGDLI